MANKQQRSSPGEVFVAFLRLGCISFGGPIAHLGYFRDAFVERWQCCFERTYTACNSLHVIQHAPRPALCAGVQALHQKE